VFVTEGEREDDAVAVWLTDSSAVTDGFVSVPEEVTVDDGVAVSDVLGVPLVREKDCVRDGVMLTVLGSVAEALGVALIVSERVSVQEEDSTGVLLFETE
jgi:hypothetical protein